MIEQGSGKPYPAVYSDIMAYTLGAIFEILSGRQRIDFGVEVDLSKSGNAREQQKI